MDFYWEWGERNKHFDLKLTVYRKIDRNMDLNEKL